MDLVYFETRLEHKMPSVFISWSGSSSKKAAEILYNWLPVALQTIKPFLSSESLKKGGRWQTDLTAELAKESFGIVCLTPTNLTAPWILFEAGALSKSLGDGQVAPFLLGVKPSDLPPPLTQFNAVFAERDEFKRLLKAINDRVPEEAVDQARIDKAVDGLWPAIEKELKDAEETPAKSIPIKPQAPETQSVLERFDPILQELLVLNRQQSQFLSKVDDLQFSSRAQEIESESQTRGRQERRTVSELLRQLWLVLDVLRHEDLSDSTGKEVLRLDELSRFTANRFSINRQEEHRRRRVLTSRGAAEVGLIEENGPINESYISFGYSGLGEPPLEELSSRIGDVVSVRAHAESRGVLRVRLLSPLDNDQRVRIDKVARDLGFEKLPS
jgi:TIR domain-containing protein